MVDCIDKKMIFFDIDGTLITDDGTRTFPESAKEAIRLARKNGHLTFINTGRVFVNIEEFIKDAGFDGYVCGCGTYINMGGKVLLHNKLTHEKCLEIAYKCREYDMMAIFEHTNHTAYDREIKGDANKELLDYFKTMNRKLIDNIEDSEFVFDKFAAWYNEGSPKLESFKQYISNEFECIQREGNFLEVVPKGFSKATGIKFLMEHHKISIDKVLVFGDSNNDLEMIQYVPNSIVMGNCTPEVLAVASYQTDKVEDDGIYNALKHFGVI